MKEAALLPVPLDKGIVNFGNLSTVDKAALAQNKSRAPPVLVAKKLIKLEAMLDDVERDLAPFALTPPAVNSPAECQRLELVPYVPSVPLHPKNKTKTPDQTESTSTTPVHEALLNFIPKDLTKHGAYMMTTLKFLAYVPVVFGYVALIYTALGVAYVVAHPELLVPALFKGLDLLPNYAEFFFIRVTDAVKAELAERFR